MGQETAWAAGTHEYRPMGVAVIAKTDLFRAADFRADRRRPRPSVASFAGYFASIGQVNAYLVAQRRLRPGTRRRVPSSESIY
jgi:hypothetical protein